MKFYCKLAALALLSFPAIAGAQIKISQLPAANPLSDTDIVPITQGTVTNGATALQIKTYVLAGTVQAASLAVSGISTLGTTNTGALTSTTLAATALPSGSGNAFLCWNSSTGQVTYLATPACDGFTPVSLSAANTWTAQQTFSGITDSGSLAVSGVSTLGATNTGALTSTTLSATATPAAIGNAFLCWNSSTGAVTYATEPTCGGWYPVSLSVANTWTAQQTFSTILASSGTFNNNLTAGALTVVGASTLGPLTTSGAGTAAAVTGGTTSGAAALVVNGGTSSANFSAVFRNNAGNAPYFETIFGDGGVTFGTPSGGDCGVGCINAQTIEQNGVPLTQIPPGYKEITGAYTVETSDCGSILQTTANLTITLPTSAPQPCVISITTDGSTTLELTAASGTTLYWQNGSGSAPTGNRTIAGASNITLLWSNGAGWQVWGSGIS